MADMQECYRRKMQRKTKISEDKGVDRRKQYDCVGFKFLVAYLFLAIIS